MNTNGNDKLNDDVTVTMSFRYMVHAKQHGLNPHYKCGGITSVCPVEAKVRHITAINKNKANVLPTRSSAAPP